jgi:SAM-dependent methyltransferase
MPWQGRGLEIGVGTARFAAPLGVQVGLDPSRPMLEYAFERGISTIQGVAEALPFRDGSYDYAVAVTTI